MSPATNHHIMELIVSNVYQNFQKFQNCWENIDKSKFKSGLDDSEVLKKLNKFEKHNINNFINEQLSKIHPEEFLELTATFLGQKNDM